MLLFRGSYWLLGAVNSVWLTWYIDKSDQCNPGATAPYKGDRAQVISGSCPRILTVLRSFTRIATLLYGKLGNDQPFHFEQLNKIKTRRLVTLQYRLL